MATVTACTGLRILEIAEGFGPVGICGQLFAGLGAEVVKLERPEGDPLRRQGLQAPDGVSHLFHLLHAGKQSVVVSLSASGQLTCPEAELASADVVLLDSALALAPEGFNAAAFAARWPDKVLCTISTFGRSGQRSDWLGNELIAQAMGGLMACTGYPERAPVRSGMAYATHIAGLFAFQGVMAALRRRDTTGCGNTIDLSSVDCLVTLLGNFIPSFFMNGREPKRVGNRHTIASPWNLYHTADGDVVICTGTGGSGWWEAVATAIERPELANDERYDREDKRVARVEEVDEIVSQWTRAHTCDEVVARMSDNGVPVSRIAPVETVLADPHYRDIRAMVVEGSGKDGITVPFAGLPVKVGTWAPPAKAGPALGEHDPAGRVARQNQPAGTAAATVAPTAAPTTTPGLLAGVTVLEFGSRTSVPIAGRMLADLGADVIKIEPLKGESLRGAGQQIGGSSYLFHINNAGKRSVVIDPASAAGRELIVQLATKADVWMENLTPGALERMGLGFKDLQAVNPALVYCSVSGFGHRSGYGDAKALDAVVQAASGGMFLTGYPDHLPVKIGLSASDLAAGVALVGGVLAGLRQRSLSGQGGHIDLAMADVGAWMTQSTWPEVFFGSGHPQRSGNRSNEHCPYNTFATSDGHVAIAVETDAQWARLVPQLEFPRGLPLATQADRLGHVALIEATVSQWVADKTAAQVASLCQSLGVPAAPVRGIADIVADPDVKARGLIVELLHPVAGKMDLLGNPLQFSATPVTVDTPAPVLGQHTVQILKDLLNLDADAIEALRASKTIGIANAS